jgi:hypothetical protein
MLEEENRRLINELDEKAMKLADLEVKNAEHVEKSKVFFYLFPKYYYSKAI